MKKSINAPAIKKVTVPTREQLLTSRPNENEPAHKVISDAITDIAKAMKALSTSRLKRETIITLVQAKSGLPKRDIEIVMNNLEQLEQTWLKPAPKQ